MSLILSGDFILIQWILGHTQTVQSRTDLKVRPSLRTGLASLSCILKGILEGDAIITPWKVSRLGEPKQIAPLVFVAPCKVHKPWLILAKLYLTEKTPPGIQSATEIEAGLRNFTWILTVQHSQISWWQESGWKTRWFLGEVGIHNPQKLECQGDPRWRKKVADHCTTSGSQTSESTVAWCLKCAV